MEAKASRGGGRAASPPVRRFFFLADLLFPLVRTITSNRQNYRVLVVLI